MKTKQELRLIYKYIGCDFNDLCSHAKDSDSLQDFVNELDAFALMKFSKEELNQVSEYLIENDQHDPEINLENVLKKAQQRTLNYSTSESLRDLQSEK